MGGSDSKSASAQTDGSSASSTSAASAGGTPVYVNVYEPSNAQAGTNIPGFGVYHSGVEVHGTEYVFAGGASSALTGVYSQKARWQPANSPWKYKESVAVGHTAKTKTDVQAVVKSLEPEFLAGAYHITGLNCNHFSERLCVALELGPNAFPQWVNRAAKTGGGIASALGIDPMKFASQSGGGGGGSGVPQAQPLEAVKPIEIVDLSGQLETKNMACLNRSAKHEVGDVMQPKSLSKFLESDCDEQFLLFVPFTKVVKMHTLSFGVYPPDSVNAKYNPKLVKLFVGQRNLDFTDAPAHPPTMTLAVDQLIAAAVAAKLKAEGKTAGKKSGADDVLMLTVALPLTKFQCNSFQMFVETNFGGETSRLRCLSITGQP